MKNFKFFELLVVAIATIVYRRTGIYTATLMQLMLAKSA
jgi:hypothetical protein